MKKLSFIFISFLATTSYAQNVGIGTPSPTEKLHVVGGTRITDLSGTNNRLVISSPTGVLSNIANGSSGRVLTSNGSGGFYWSTPTNGDVTSINAGAGLTGGGPAGNITVNAAVDNGLYVNAAADRIRLGGPLVEPTTITHSNFTLIHNLNSAGDFHIQDNGVNHFSVFDNGDASFGGDVYWRDENSAGTILAQLIDDGDDGRFIIRDNGAVSVDLDANTQYIFNEQGLDRNFRVESDAVASMFMVDGGSSRVGIGTGAPVDRFHVAGGRVEFTATTDASGVSGSGVLEIANTLRLDGNEIITNNDSPLSLQHDNNGDLFVDATTLVVDASANRVGIGTLTPVDRFHVEGGRVEFTATTDASGISGTGVLEIANTLRLDGNEIITNNGFPLSLQSDNGGDLLVDFTTFVVDASANRIGVRTNTPQTTFHMIQGSTLSSSAGLRLEHNNNGIHWTMYTANSNNLWFMYNGVLASWITPVGLFNTSDRSLKENITKASGVLDRALQLNAVTYNYKSDDKKRMTIGFIAQEVNELFPQSVEFEEEFGKYGIKYDDFGVISIAAIQELKQRYDIIIENQQSEIDQMRAELEEIKKLLKK